MFTLQILAAGRTSVYSLEAPSTTFGSSEEADVQLRGDAVLGIHARLSMRDDSLSLTAEADVVVNGVNVREASLGPGDRLEIGAAVMIVGRTAAQPAASSPPTRQRAPSRVAAQASRRAPRPRSSAPKVAAAFVVLLALGAAVAVAALGDDRGEARSLVAMVDDLRSRGKLEDARAEAARLRALWAESQDGRLVDLAAAEAQLAAVDAAREALEAQILDPAGGLTYAKWLRELREMESRGSVNQRVAARKVRGTLRELVDRRDELAEVRRASAPVAIGKAPASASDVVTLATGAAAAATDLSRREQEQEQERGAASPAKAPEVDIADVEVFCEQGEFTRALALIQAGFETVATSDQVAALQQAKARVRDRAVNAMTALLTESKQAEERGYVEQAAKILQRARSRFPAGVTFQPLGRELARLDALAVEKQRAAAQAAAVAVGPKKVDEATRLQTLASLRSHMDKIRGAEDGGDYAAAATLLREAAAAVRARDGEFADRLLTRAAESDLLAGWNAAVVTAIEAGKELTTTDMSGREVELLRVEGGRIIARSADGEAPLEWFEVDAAGMQKLAGAIRAKDETALGLAALLYKNGESVAAERVLADLLRSDTKKWKAPVNDVLARGRGEALGGAGYELRKGEFISLRDVELAKLGKNMMAKLQTSMRSRDRSDRDAFVAATVAEGELQREALGVAVRELLLKSLGSVQSSSLKKQVDSLTRERDELDAARSHAKALIFDEVKYFYPYKPPAVSGEKHSEYNRVQQEVDERIAALRKIWQGSKTSLRVSKKFGDDLARVDWLAEQMTRLGSLPKGESVATMLQPIAWARALEPGEAVTLQTFSLTPAERAQRVYWRQIREYNEAAKDDWSVAVTTLLRITNDYREMFGHRPLAAVKSACEASQGHADEMSKLGYFAHMSPTPGRKTPTDRMRLAGYTSGVSENIAMTGGALSSHVAWCHSSGHHRNLLSPGHREIGIGANGRYWVQNFGSGDVHKSHPLWPSIDSK
ncbi:MAG: hypothetical protein CMJ88_11910 [Planctomycetes bacterium]|nr:hypothetical protein [Planctomycetota bacterium]